ncbi:MAG: haloacid dehalogenase-like hydrolase [Gammaproteobacteria bacterium]|nr:haloacid dehalogenase-like hydrolase [Gammaproteobacteria bacterium]NNL99224.1 haloacid dehalogenase-like hydrolase [Gammaproteobacteria bacterium]
MTDSKHGDFQQSILALVYDFDGTLTPQPMQEYTVFPKLGIEPQSFWREVQEQVVETEGDQILTYMRLLIEKIEEKKEHLSRQALQELARDIEYFPGVESWFERINRYVAEASDGTVTARHYIISAGLSEILAGVSIRHHFERIYASQYHFDHHEVAVFPTVVINDTAKTQFLFRINKGREGSLESINEYMPEEERPIPFEHMLYLGDGHTDVPCMTVAKKYGGFAIAVHKPDHTDSVAVCRELAAANRIDFFAPADYREGTLLDQHVTTILELIIARIRFARAKHDFYGAE